MLPTEVGQKKSVISPLLPKSDLEILLCLTPGDFTLSNARRFYSV